MHVPLSALPAWPQWKFRGTNGNHNTVEIDSEGRLVVGGNGFCAVCRLDHAVAAQLRVNPVPRPNVATEWPSQGIPVDMNPQINMEILGERYNEALHGAPLAVFAKTALARARVGSSPALVGALRRLARSPADLDSFYADPPPDFTARVHREGLPLRKALDKLLVRETELQVTVHLELLSHIPAAEAMLDHHFDRLCIWEAFDTDFLVEFCSEVVLPFFRSVAPDKTRELLKRARGVSHDAPVPRPRKHRPGPLRNHPLASTADSTEHSVLFKAVQKVGASSGDTSNSLYDDPSTDSAGQESRAPKIASRHASSRWKDTVEVSFRRSSRQETDAPSRTQEDAAPLPLQNNSFVGRKPKLEPVQRSKSVPLVNATPTAQRMSAVRVEPVPLDLEAIGSSDESTDDDADPEHPTSS